MLHLPNAAADAYNWTWAEYDAHFQTLLAAELTPDSLPEWLKDWAHLSNLLSEVDNRFYVAASVDTADKEAEARVEKFQTDIAEPKKAVEEKLRQKLIASGLNTEGMEQVIKRMKAASDLFREANLPRETELVKLGMEHDKLCGARSVDWNGEEKTLPSLALHLQSDDRSEREKAWTLRSDRILADREAMNELWVQMYDLRQEIAREAGHDSFTGYMFQALNRFDYTPENCAEFRQAIRDHVVPACQEIYTRRQTALGVDSLRPWDLDVDVSGQAPLRPFASEAELLTKSRALFDRIDPQLGAWFQDMADEGLIDLYARKNKANGGYCTSYPLAKRPFVFMNAVGTHDDLQTLIHEAGHCFHVYETTDLPYVGQTDVGSEFAEVASMGMEMLAQAHLDVFYSDAESARAQKDHLEGTLLFWPYMSVVDAFQHWACSTPEGRDPAACDAKWSELWDQFMPGIDYSGLEAAKADGWHRKLHIFVVPFYYVEYGLAQMGAMQVWQNSLKDSTSAVENYRRGLRLGGSKSLPELFQAAGAKFAFDGDSLGGLVKAMTGRLSELQG